jgi:predicted GNAT family acetyltransferase
MSEIKIEDNRILLEESNRILSWVEYEKSDDAIHLIATFTTKGEGGKGYASKVVEKALDYAKHHGKIRISCPYIKHWIEKHKYDIEVEFTPLLFFKKEIERFNKLHSPEAIAEFLGSNEKVARVGFTGPFCVTCGVYDYFEDLIQDFEADVLDYEETDGGFIVRYEAKNGFY